jgi:plasmid stabilization system protein ParE
MIPQIKQSKLALRDIDELASYYLREAGVAVALRFLNNAENALASLAELPRMGVVAGFPQEDLAKVRRWHIDAFPRLIILYRVLPDGIEVIRVVDGGRDIRALFADPESPA